ncbi:MAG: O-antigen ligase family protein [Candidatus Pacebacteria bacterium]|nr:O-antigen ligase family protein [Candidatus Paceibacterota bacterium]MDR3583248.1 O-antigen ligase family protein [Candidatus Paceibacterota bacterium]
MKKLFSLENFIYFTVAALPVYLLKFQIFGFPTNLLEFLIPLVFIWWLVKCCRVETRQCLVSTEAYPKKIILSAGLIFIGLLISMLANINPMAGLGIIKSWFVFPWLLVFVIYKYISKDKLVNIFRAIYLSSFGVALVSLGYLLADRMTYDGRLEAFFNSPNYLAMYLAPGIIIGLCLKTQSSKASWKMFFEGITLLIILAAFYKTYSYAAWLSVTSSLLAIFLIQKNISLKKISLTVAIVIMLVLSQFNNPKFIELITLGSRSSIASREMIWRAAGKILEDHWLIGIGPSNFQPFYLESQKYFPPYLEWAVPHPQNVYLAFWLSGGILGLLGFFLVLYFYFKNIFQKIKNTSGDASIFILSFGIVLYFLLHGLVDTTILKNDLAVVFWLNFLVLG